MERPEVIILLILILLEDHLVGAILVSLNATLREAFTTLHLLGTLAEEIVFLARRICLAFRDFWI